MTTAILLLALVIAAALGLVALQDLIAYLHDHLDEMEDGGLAEHGEDDEKEKEVQR